MAGALEGVPPGLQVAGGLVVDGREVPGPVARDEREARGALALLARVGRAALHLRDGAEAHGARGALRRPGQRVDGELVVREVLEVAVVDGDVAGV